MLRHVVTFRLSGTPDEQLNYARQFRDALLELPREIPELHSMEVGINCNPGEADTLTLIATVDSLETLPLYARHPAHLAAVEIIKPYITLRTCVDYLF